MDYNCLNWSLEERIYVYSFLEGMALILGWTQSRIDYCQNLHKKLCLTEENSAKLRHILGRLPHSTRLVNIKKFGSSSFDFVTESLLDLIIIEQQNKFSVMAEIELFTLNKYLL